MIRLITITSIILSLFLTALAQSGGSLTGRIVSTDGNALAGISVSLEETPFTATTDPNGRFSFNNVPAGRYVLVISGGGFVPQTHDVEIKAGETASIDGRLYKITASIDVVASLAEYHLEETSSATKTATRLIDLPQSVQVFPNQLIEDRAITEGNELFRNISGLNQSTYSAMVFRGFTEREILYNGARGNPFGSLEGDVNNSGFSTSQIRLTNIQRVEVLKGPTAALYGSGEPGGLINYVTKKPKETLDAEIQLRLGSFGQKMVSGDITGPATDSLLYRGAFYFEDRDSFRALLGRGPQRRQGQGAADRRMEPFEGDCVPFV